MQVQLEHGSTLRVYYEKSGPMSILGTAVYPRSHMCMSLKYWQLGCQHANSHQAGIVESWVDHNEQGIKPETCQGYQEKMVWKTTEDLKRIQDPQIPVANAIDEIPKLALYMCSPLRLVHL